MFIDRDPRWFRLVLNFLRDGGCELPDASVDRRELMREADYYQARAANAAHPARGSFPVGTHRTERRC